MPVYSVLLTFWLAFINAAFPPATAGETLAIRFWGMTCGIIAISDCLRLLFPRQKGKNHG